ncbi:hypothetical protein FACS1894121_1690 [Bacteroidia bacterium]|nr:hypothetical protein FACS1894121_1690 [Bacteroidia bacterium]
MSTTEMTFNDMPEAMTLLIGMVGNIETMLRTEQPQAEEADRWFDMEALRDYLPDHPSRAAIYVWKKERQLPSHKPNKKLMFLKSEIDRWFRSNLRKTQQEIDSEAQQSEDIRKAKIALEKMKGVRHE